MKRERQTAAVEEVEEIPYITGFTFANLVKSLLKNNSVDKRFKYDE